MAVVAIWGLIGVLAVSVGCSPDSIIPRPGIDHCVNSVGLHILHYLASYPLAYALYTD